LADAATDMALAHARRAEDQDRGALVEPGAATGQRHDVRLGQHRHLGEVEARQRLGCIELRLGPMALGAALGALGHLVFQQAPQEATRWPTVLVRALCQFRPQPSDRGQAQLGEHQRVAPGVNGGGGHAATSSSSSSCLLGSNAS
jgi:hypothetical protein